MTTIPVPRHTESPKLRLSLVTLNGSSGSRRYSEVESKTKFKRGSKPRRIPTTSRPPMNLTRTCLSMYLVRSMILFLSALFSAVLAGAVGALLAAADSPGIVSGGLVFVSSLATKMDSSNVQDRGRACSTPGRLAQAVNFLSSRSRLNGVLNGSRLFPVARLLIRELKEWRSKRKKLACTPFYESERRITRTQLERATKQSPKCSQFWPALTEVPITITSL